MRLRIVHQLALLLAGIALLSTAAVGALVAWNLRAGFSDYLKSRDQQQLERFAQVVADRVDAGSLTAGKPLQMRELMDEFLHRDGQAPPPGSRAQGRPPRGPEAPSDAPGEQGGPPQGGSYGEGRPPRGADPEGRPPLRGGPGARPPRQGPPGGLPQRIQVVDLQGTRLGGPPFPQGREVLEQAVRINGQPVAYVRMLPSEQLQAVDARFLQRQYAGLAGALAVTLLLAVALAAIAARWLGAPLAKVQAATHRIAHGELDVMVPESGSREMAALIADVNRMAASLNQLEGARRRWIAQMSHELRTPLSVLLGELESVQDGAREANAQTIASLRDEVLQLVRLVNDLHTLSMADLRALPCEFVDGDVGSALQRAAARMEPRLRQAGLSLAVTPGPQATACWDFGRIAQLLTNLLENSLRYTDAPGRVDVHWDTVGRDVVLRVDDSPPGVEPSQFAQLFEPLYRADEARQRVKGASGGSGLGLAICKAIVEAHGGSIIAMASPLGGLRIEARLPLNAHGDA
ncbi:ATP-binding protein [Ramlibacter albus]|uniref:histidine kinase n=1 Tax=Ramlibacter albus TaxID=2079448 RepID=A0A923MGP2_9BURK|nr:ATP-binding protein [Ramlibacter albus]MBC5768632.1 HAMP domain-containing protein [Ramlibacter albus]